MEIARQPRHAGVHVCDIVVDPGAYARIGRGEQKPAAAMGPPGTLIQHVEPVGRLLQRPVPLVHFLPAAPVVGNAGKPRQFVLKRIAAPVARLRIAGYPGSQKDGEAQDGRQ